MRKKNEKLTDSPMGMWFFGRYVNGGGPTNLMAPLQWVRWKASTDRMQEDFLALGAIGEDDQRKGESEKIREFERMRESRSEEKKGRREVLVKRKERGVMKNVKR